MAIVGAGGALATGIAPTDGLPTWVPVAVALGFALLAVLYSNYCQPRKVEELRSKLFFGVGAALLAGTLVSQLWKFLA